MKILNVIEKIKADSRFSRKNELTIIDDLEAFRIYLKINPENRFPLQKILINSKIDWEKIGLSEYLRKLDDLVEPVDEKILVRVLKVENPQICALIKIPSDIYNYREIIENLTQTKVCIVLDSIQNPWNLGGILRTNSAFGVFNNILLGNPVFPYNPRVIRSSKGYIFEQNIKIVNEHQINDLSELVEEYKPDIFFLENKPDAEEVNQINLTNRICFLVLGNEERGISENTRKIFKGYRSVRIPIRTESLNVFSAHSILLFVLSQQLRNL
ncbi:MAG: RNA methyltransferase [Candidatus Calescibacterium sp.]|nr:RNA methyltransferase [Candidatus Calescibacterium sp.]MCX7972630.1 RNA methyltransferase [bacterium]MDW8194773.1 RNA methyltransferase [Candidatus Calescibacterium sp.]